MQNKVLRTARNFPRCITTRELHVAFGIPNAHDFIIQLCRKQAEVAKNHENAAVLNIRQVETMHRKYEA